MEWRVIPGFPAYEISESGTVRKDGTKCSIAKNGRRYGLWDGRQRRYFYPFELVEKAFGPREGEAAAMPMEAQPPAAAGGETGTQPWSPEHGQAKRVSLQNFANLEIGPASISVPAVPEDDKITALERENLELREMVAELEAIVQVCGVEL